MKFEATFFASRPHAHATTDVTVESPFSQTFPGTRPRISYNSTGHFQLRGVAALPPNLKIKGMTSIPRRFDDSFRIGGRFVLTFCISFAHFFLVLPADEASRFATIPATAVSPSSSSSSHLSCLLKKHCSRKPRGFIRLSSGCTSRAALLLSVVIFTLLFLARRLVHAPSFRRLDVSLVTITTEVPRTFEIAARRQHRQQSIVLVSLDGD